MAVKLTEGGLQSFDPSQSAKTTIRKGTFIGGSGRISSLDAIRVRRQAEIDARLQADIQREAQRQIEAEAARQADIQREIQSRIKQEEINRETLRIQRFKDKLIRQNAIVRSNILTDKDTKDKIREDVIINRKGEKILVRTNLKTGEVNTRTFEKMKRNGVKLTGGITTMGQKAVDTKRATSALASGISVPSGTGKFTKAIDVGRGNMQDATFTFSDGKITKVTLLGKPMPQSKRFKEKKAEDDSVVEKVQVKSFIEKIEAGQQNAERRRLELRKELQGMTDKTSKRASKIKNELIFMTVISEVSESALGIKQLGDIIFKESKKAFTQIREDPKMIVPISKAIASGTIPVLRKVADGLLEEVRETGELLVVSPNEGFVKLGLIWLSFKSVGGVAKITGKATKLGVKSAKKASVGSANVIVTVTRSGGKAVGGRLKRGGLKLNIIPKGKVTGSPITLRQIKAQRLSKDIDRIADMMVRDYERRTLLKLSLSDKISLQKAFKKEARRRLDLVLKQPKSLEKLMFITKVERRLSRAQRKIAKAKKGVKGAVKRKVSKITPKGLKKKIPKKRLITKKEVQRELKAKLFNKKLDSASRRLTDALIKRSGKEFTIFEHAQLEKAIKELLREAVAKRTTSKALSMSANKIVKNRSLVKRIIDKVKKGELKFREKFLTERKKIDNRLLFVLKSPEVLRRKTLKNSILKLAKKNKKALDDLILGKQTRIGKKFEAFENIQIAKLRKFVTGIEKKILKKKLIISRGLKRKIKKVKGKLVIKRLRKVKSKKRLITSKQLQRELSAEALSKNIKNFSERFAGSLIRRSRLKVSLFDRVDLEKAIASKIRNSLSDKKVITVKTLMRNSNRVLRDKNVQKALVQKALKPEFKIITTKARRFRVIEEPAIKATNPLEHTKRGMVLLQKTKKVQKQSNIIRIRMKPLLQKTKTVQVRKQLVSQRTKLVMANKSLSKQLSLSKSLLKGATASLMLLKSKKLSASAQKSAQQSVSKVASLSKSISESMSKNASAIMSLQMSLLKSKQRAAALSRSLSKGKKGKVPVARIEKIKKAKKKKQFDAFAVKFMSKGKVVKSKMPLSFQDAKDLLAYRIDRRLIRTGKVVPVGKVSKLGKLSKGIKGAFNARKKKFRIFRLKKKKKVKFSERRFIEKKKYVGDTKNEIRLLQKARAKARSKRKVAKKKRK